MTTGQPHGHAIIIGASMAGLLAARTLADLFARVTILDRDTLPAGAVPRKGVPQGRHAHILLGKGQALLEGFFPGLMDELVAAGATAADLTGECRIFQAGGYPVPFASGLVAVTMSRPLLEGTVRARVRALPNVRIVDGCDVSGLATTADGARVTGVTLGTRADGAGDDTLTAELVVDAGGRGSRAPAWLEALGYDRPTEEKIVVGVGYTTRIYRRCPGDLPHAKVLAFQPDRPRETRTGVLLPIEGDRWIAMLGGWLGDHAPADQEGFLAFARSLPAPDLYDVLRRAEPLGDAAVHKFPANLRRRYEQLARVPEGYLAIGDALCSFNPVYGQGMTVAALEAVALAECVRAGRGGLIGLPRRFYRRAARVIDTPWQLAAGADFAYPAVAGRRPPGTGALNRYVGLVQRAALEDARVCRTFVAVTQLLAPPSALLAPRILWRVARAALRRGPRRAIVPTIAAGS